MKHGHLKKKIGSLLLAAVLVAGTAPNSVPEAGRLIRKRSRQSAYQILQVETEVLLCMPVRFMELSVTFCQGTMRV